MAAAAPRTDKRRSLAPAPARIVMTAAERRESLIDCAQDLFLTTGYDAVSVNDIIMRAGVSKGGFYHHFAAKEDLLDAVTARMTQEVISSARDVLDDPDLTALERLNGFFARAQQWKAKTAPRMRLFAEALLRPENVILRHRSVAAASEALQPAIAGIIASGVEDGAFKVVDPEIVAEIFLAMSHARSSVIIDAIALTGARGSDVAVKRVMERLTREAATMDRLLGIPAGSIRLFDASALRAVFKVFAART